MHRKARIVAGTLPMAALGVAGTHSGAHASAVAGTCSHGVVAPAAGHPNGRVRRLPHRTGRRAHPQIQAPPSRVRSLLAERLLSSHPSEKRPPRN